MVGGPSESAVGSVVIVVVQEPVVGDAALAPVFAVGPLGVTVRGNDQWLRRLPERCPSRWFSGRTQYALARGMYSPQRRNGAAVGPSPPADCRERPLR